MKSHSKFRLKVSGITSRIILTLLLGIIFFPAHTYAAIYYVDYNSGLDSNPGTSKAAPWKRAPGMKGFTGSYTHAAGDKIIFKGGVTWPSAVLPITIKEGWDGTAANWDYHGIDSTWFSGTVFNRPKFDGQRLIGIIMSLSYTNNALIDGIEFTGSVTKDGTGESTISAYDPGAVTFNNLYIHNWDKNATTDNGGGGGIYISYLRHRGEVTVQNSILNNQDGRQNHPGYMVGGCLRGVDNVINCELAYAIQGLLHGGKTFAYNHVHHISSKFYDPAAHDNTAYLDSDPLYQTNGRYPSIQVYGNHFHDLNCSTGAVYINPKGNDYFYVYNNLFINVNDVANILVDTYMGTGEVYIWNNTFYISDQVDVVRGGISGGGRVATKKLVVQNNHIMSDKSGSGIDNTNVTTFIADHNLKQTMAVASAAGYTAAKNYSPVASSSPTVNAGTTIISAICNKITVDYNGVARAQGGIWDIGAYEFGGTIDSQAPTAPANLVSSNVVQTGFTLSWTASTDNTGVTGYEVFRGTTSCGTTAATTMSIAGLTCNTTYSMTVKARDASGNWSVASTAKSVTTSACTGDTEAPTAPTALVASAKTQTSFTLTWTASTDNVGVVSYEVFRGMVSCGTTTSTSLAITGLASGTTYAMTVKAKDAAGNVSAASTTLNVTTTKYTLTVTGGTGGGTYKDGTVVAIAANAPATGKVFDKWTGDVTNVANVNAASTTITMSAAKTVVVATYKDIPVATYTVTFMITDGTKTVSGASVTYNSETKTTDASGQVIFTNVPQASNLTYAITAPGFKPTTVSINVVNNITKQVVLQTDALDTEKSIDEIRVYPNPATDYIKILTTNRAGGTVSVVNCSGVTIIKEKIVSEETLINVSGWTKGLYLMIVSGSEYTVEKQFIVQ